MRDDHTHCPCNGVWLCPACHSWAHGHPAEAREQGFIVTRMMTTMWEIPYRTPLGWLMPDCQGGAKEVL